MTGESFYDFSRLSGQKSDIHNQARPAQFFYTSPGNLWIRIGKRCHNTPDAGLDQSVGAGAGSPLMGTGLKSYIGRRAVGGLARFTERGDFGVITQEVFMMSLPYYGPIPGNDATHARIGTCQSRAFLGKAKSLLHEFIIFA
jgi:hypothetical protein